MSGIMAAAAGILSAGGGGGGREPSSGDYYDANNRVTYVTEIGIVPPYDIFTSSVFRWGGVDVYSSGGVPYPAAAPAQVTVGAYTYFTGSSQSASGGNPATDTYGIYRTS